MTVAAGDAHDFCIYAGRYRVTFPLLDADGDLVVGATGLDSERSIDMGTYADCSNEATQIATNSGTYFLDLIATETTGTNVSVIVKTGDAKTTFLSIPIVRLPVLRSGTAQAGGASTITLDSEASAKDGAYVGLYAQCTNNSPANVQGQTRKIISYVGSTKVATVGAAWGTNPDSSTTFSLLIPVTANINSWMGKETVDPTTDGVPEVDVTHIAGSAVSTTSAQLGVNVVNAGGTAWASGSLTSGVFASGAITATAIAADAIGASELAADAVAEIADAVWDEDATGHQTGGTFGQAIGDPGADTNTIFKATVTDATGATVGVDVAAVLADTGTDGVVVASIANGAITAAAIATDAIDADALAADALAEINAEIVDVLTVDTFAQPGQESPAATQTIKNMVAYLYKAWRNRHTQTSSEYALYADDATTKDQEATVSDNGTTFDRGEISTGA